MPEARIAVVGAGAVGGYIAGKLKASGHDVVAIDSWVEHVERIRAEGLTIVEPGGNSTVRLEALHLSDVQSLVRKPVDVALICTKSYDTAWAAKMIEPYLAQDACVVSIQNSLNEEQIAAVVGWERTLGCIASTISVAAPRAGEISRARTPGGSTYTVFRVGEAHGRVTPRALRLAALLANVDSSKVTTNLWGERWAKLVTNSMHHGILGSTGISDHDLMKNTATRRLAIRCAGEAIRVAQALGHPLEPILRMPASLWLAASRGEKAPLAELEAGWIQWMERSKEPHYGSIGQDLAKGRRTEIDYVCGYVAMKGDSVGVPAPTQRALYQIVKRVERGEIPQGMDNIASLLEQSGSDPGFLGSDPDPLGVNNMGKHIVFIGAGAVGGYVGGHLTRVGENVTLVDPWPEHVRAMREHGLHLGGSQGEYVVKVNAIDISDVQSFVRKPVDIAVICTKSYDTEWSAMMIGQYLSPEGYCVSMQNGINEERIARAVGWGRTVGTTVSTISVNAYQPGYIKRYQQPSSQTNHAVFRVGEVHGLVTERVTDLARIFGSVDAAKVTTNLWGERWTKLTANTITHGLLGATGLDNTHVYVQRGRIHRLGVKLGAEAVAVGRAQGYELGTILGISPDDWYAAGALEDAAAIRRVQDGLTAWMATLLEPSHSSVGRDVQRGRRSEIDFTNGLVAQKGAEAGVPAPTHAAVTELVRRIDRGELKPDPSNVENIPA